MPQLVPLDDDTKKKIKLTPLDTPKGKPRDSYLSESLGALKTGAKEFAQGAVDTVKGMGQDYARAGPGEHPGMFNLAAPIYGVGGALRGLASSPAAEFAESAVLGAGGVEAGPAHDLRLKREPVPANRVAAALRSDRVPETLADPKIALPEGPAERPSMGVELSLQRGAVTPPSASAAAPKIKLTPLDEAKPKAKTSSKMSDEEFHNYIESMPDDKALKYIKSMPKDEYQKRYPLAGRRVGIDYDEIDLTKPIVAYHGTNEAFNKFDPTSSLRNKGGGRTLDPTEKGVSFFSRTPGGASTYADLEGGNIHKVHIDPTDHVIYNPQELLNNPKTRDSFIADLKSAYMHDMNVRGGSFDKFRAEELWENRKNILLDQAAEGEGVSHYPTTGALIERAKREGAGSATLRNLMESHGHDQVIVLNHERISSAWKQPLRPNVVAVRDGPEAPPAPGKLRGAPPVRPSLPGAGDVVIDIPGVSKIKNSSTYQAPTIDSSGNKIGFTEFIYRKGDNHIQMRYQYLDEEHRGKGFGLTAARKIIDWAHSKGLDVESSTSLNKESTGVYEALKRRGYKVEEPSYIEHGGGSRTQDKPYKLLAPKSQPVGAAPSGYPELSTTGKGGAQAILQQRLGLGERASSKAITALEPYQAQLNASPRLERLKVIDYMENRSHGNMSIDPKFKPAADEMRRVYKDIEYRLGETTSTEDMRFIEDYFRHQVKDPKKITQFMTAFKEGSAKGATKKRSFPTVADLLEAGHELANDNPVEVTMDYAYHMNKFIATNEAFDIAKSQGTIKYMSPSRVPEGYLPISGRHGGLNQHGQAAYAPAEFAKPWNAFVSQGFTGLGGDILHGARSITNAVTAVKLMSGYHFSTMGAASFTSELSRAFDNLAYGRPMTALRAGGSAATILGPVIRQFKTGLRGQRLYAGGAGSAEENKVIDYLTQANFRPSRIDRSISVTQTGNLYTAWKRGALSHQLRSQMSDIAAAPGVMKAAPIARGVWSLFGRTIDTIMAPLFEKTIPALKTGAAMESLRDFLIAHPSASFEEIMTEARAVQRNMDDRFGEMNHDNLFWNQKLKEGLQASMLSYSWNVGIGRALGGGGKDIVAALGSKATQGKFGSAGWTRRASYALAFPIGAAYLSAVYQALKMGQAPSGPQDLLAPRTGGVNPASKYRKESDERIAVPGHMKDVFEVRDILTGDKTVWDVAANKLNPVLRLAGNMIVGRDWRGNPIADPEAATQDRVKQYLSYAGEQMSPIALSQFERRKEGTNINLFETVLGIHPAPDFLQDPSGHGDMMRGMANQQWIKTLSAMEREAKGRGDISRATAVQSEIHRRQQQMKRIQP
jgi:predicted GNAT family acetyltransferase